MLFRSDSWAAISPRISWIVPSGNASRGLGNGSHGLQLNLPVSKRISQRFIVHGNAGYTLLGHMAIPGADGSYGKLNSYNFGASAIWLGKKVNLMTEYLAGLSQDFNDAGGKTRSVAHIVNPGFRFAINRGGLQIVPGLGVPVTFDGGSVKPGLFLYLSFEHPFSHSAGRE